MILYYITDRKQFAGDSAAPYEALIACIAAAAQAGVDYIQLREKDLSGRELEHLAQRAMQAIAAAGEDCVTRLLINSRIDVAIAVGAAGVHLPSQGALSAADARAVFAKAGVAEPVIAVSCHSEAELKRAWSDGADLAVLGPVFEKAGAEPLGLESFQRLAARPELKMPVLALGGVTLANAAECPRAGAAGIAAVRLFQQGELRQTVQALRALAAPQASRKHLE